MADPTNDDAAKALDRLTSPDAPRPQPKPRIIPTAKVPITRSAAGKARAPKPVAVAPQPNLQQALAEARKSSSSVRTATKSGSRLGGLWLKQTLIPALLTIGLILISLAIVHFAWKSDDNPVVELPRSIVLALLGAGVVCWGLAGANMLSVRRALALSGKSEA